MATTPDRFSHLSVAALIFAAFTTAGFAAPQQSNAASLAPTNATVTISVGETEPAASVQALSGGNTATIGWSDIKDYTSEKRGQFLIGLQRMEAKANAQFNELTIKRAALKNITEAKKLDHALNELNNVRFFLKTMGEMLSQSTTPQTWEQIKARVALAWTKSQEAYAKVQVHTTS